MQVDYRRGRLTSLVFTAMGIVVSVLLYGAPLVLLGLIAKDSRSRRWACIFCLLASLVGEVGYFIAERGFKELLAVGFWEATAANFPMAIVPLGIWAGCLGTAGTLLLGVVAHRPGITTGSLSLVGVVSGIVVGAGFMFLFVLLVNTVGLATGSESILPYELAGASAGAASGAVAVLFVVLPGRKRGQSPDLRS